MSLMLMSIKLSVTNKQIMLSVIMLNVVMLSVVILNVVAPKRDEIFCTRSGSLEGNRAQKSKVRYSNPDLWFVNVAAK
jgi:hypothetical protein